MKDLFLDNDLTKYIENQRRLIDEGQIWLRVVNNEDVKNFIISLNTDDQLFDKGIDSKGVSLKEIGGNDFTDSGYSPVTIEIKRSKGGKGGKFTNITLYDTGDYYESHEVEVDETGFEIESDPIKEDTNLYEEWGEDIVGLTDESLTKFSRFLLQRYINYVRATIFKI